MYDILIHFEQSASFLNPLVLLGIGTAGVVVGILLWLGGSFGGRFSVALVLMLMGILIGLCCLVPVAALVIGLIVAVLAFLFVRFYAGLAAGMLSLILVVNGLHWVEVSETQAETSESWTIQAPEEGAMGVKATLMTLKDMVGALGKAGVQEVKSMMLIRLLYLLGIGGAIGLVCWFIRPLGIALCCAMAGMLMMVCGMVLILSYKGAQPVSYIAEHMTSSLWMADAMSVFGTLEQLFFCRRPGKRPAAKPSGKSNKD